MTNKYRDETQNPNHIFTLDDDIDQRYDPNTETWDVIIGRCPYCNEELIRNGDLKYSNCLQVKDYDNQIILVCNRCVRYMYEKGELKE
jgi:uncharacterized protein with PIN domain